MNAFDQLSENFVVFDVYFSRKMIELFQKYEKLGIF